MLRALWKANRLRAIVYFPLVVLLALAKGGMRVDKWLYAGTVLVASAASLWMTYALAGRICFGSMHCYRFLWSRWLWIGLLSIALAVPFAMIFYLHWSITLELVGLMLAPTRLACRLFDHQYLQGEFDFHVPHPMRPNRQGQSRAMRSRL